MINIARTITFTLIALFSLTGVACYAQYDFLTPPTQFDTFVQQPKIQWAAYANDYTIFEKKDFNKMLLLRLAKNEIKATLPLEMYNRYGYSTSYLWDALYIGKDSIDSVMLYPAHTGGYLFDSLGNIYSIKIEPNEIDTALLTQTDITQILYIENGILKSYVTWISPIKAVQTAQTRQFVGYNSYFSTCFNYQHDHLPRDKSNNEFLGQIKWTTRLDSLDNWRNIPLKEFYGRNLLGSLWPYIVENKIKLFSIELQRNIEPGELQYNYTFDIKHGQSFIADNLSQITCGKHITSYQLVQDWYYNYTENIVFNKVRELYVYAKDWTEDEEEGKIAYPILKIVFQQ